MGRFNLPSSHGSTGPINAAHKDFQQVVADQRQTQQLLESALGVLKGFYDKALVTIGAADRPYV